MFTRIKKDAVLGGVCTGLGKIFEVDPLFFRIVFVLSAVYLGFGAIPYLILWVLAPLSDD